MHSLINRMDQFMSRTYIEMHDVCNALAIYAENIDDLVDKRVPYLSFMTKIIFFIVCKKIKMNLIAGNNLTIMAL